MCTGKPIRQCELLKKEKIKSGEIVCAFNEDTFIGIYEIINKGDIIAKSKFVMQSIRKEKDLNN